MDLSNKQPPRCEPNRLYPVTYNTSSGYWEKLKGACNFFFNPQSYCISIHQETFDSGITCHAKVEKVRFPSFWKAAFVSASVLTVALTILSKTTPGKAFFKANPLVDRLATAYCSLFLIGFSISRIDSISNFVFNSYDNTDAGVKTVTFIKWSETTPSKSTATTQWHGKILPWVGVMGVLYSNIRSQSLSQWSPSYLVLNAVFSCLWLLRNNYSFNGNASGSILDKEQTNWTGFNHKGLWATSKSSRNNSSTPGVLFPVDNFVTVQKGTDISKRYNTYTVHFNTKNDKIPTALEYQTAPGLQTATKTYWRYESHIFELENSKKANSSNNSNEGPSNIALPTQDSKEALFCHFLSFSNHPIETILLFLEVTEKNPLKMEEIYKHFIEGGYPNQAFLALSSSRKDTLLGLDSNFKEKSIPFTQDEKTARAIYGSIQPNDLPSVALMKHLLSLAGKNGLIENPDAKTAPSLFERMVLNESPAARTFSENSPTLSKRDLFLQHLLISNNKYDASFDEWISGLTVPERVEMIEILLQYDVPAATKLIGAHSITGIFKSIDWNQYLLPLDNIPDGFTTVDYKDYKTVVFNTMLEKVVTALGYDKYFNVKKVVLVKSGLLQYEAPVPLAYLDKSQENRRSIQAYLFSVILNLPADYEILCKGNTFFIERINSYFSTSVENKYIYNMSKIKKPTVHVQQALKQWAQQETKNVDWYKYEFKVPDNN